MTTEAVKKNTIRGRIGAKAKPIAEALGQIKQVRADGNTAGADITLVDGDGRNIGDEATIISVLEVTTGGGVLVSRTAEASMTADGVMQLDTTDTSGDDLIVLLIDWQDNQ